MRDETLINTLINQVGTIALALALVSWVVYGFSLPLVQKSVLNERYVAMAKQLVGSKSDREALQQKIEAKADLLRARSRAYSGAIKQPTDLSGLIQTIYDAAAAPGTGDLAVRKITPDQNALATGAATIPVMLEIAGAYDGLQRFVEMLEGSPNIFFVKGISVTGNQQTVHANIVLTVNLRSK